MFRKEDHAALDSVMGAAPEEEPAAVAVEIETEAAPEAPEDPNKVLDNIEMQFAKLRSLFPSSAA